VEVGEDAITRVRRTPQTPKPHHPDQVQHQAIAIVLPTSLLVAFHAQAFGFLALPVTFLVLQESKSSYQQHHTNATRCDRFDT
jgi:hypothetical protein